MTVYNHYELKHQDDGLTYHMTFEADIATTVIDNFIQFMAGCGFSLDFIYGYMSEAAEMHFKMQKPNVPYHEMLLGKDPDLE
jgi:hypothetical protein